MLLVGGVSTRRWLNSCSAGIWVRLSSCSDPRPTAPGDCPRTGHSVLTSPVHWICLIWQLCLCGLSGPETEAPNTGNSPQKMYRGPRAPNVGDSAQEMCRGPWPKVKVSCEHLGALLPERAPLRPELLLGWWEVPPSQGTPNQVPERSTC